MPPQYYTYKAPTAQRRHDAVFLPSSRSLDPISHAVWHVLGNHVLHQASLGELRSWDEPHEQQRRSLPSVDHNPYFSCIDVLLLIII